MSDQHDFEAELRAGDTDELTRRGIHLSIDGLTAGLRNSG